MKKTFLLCIIVFGLFLSSTALPVGLQTAQSVAAKFMGTSDLALVSTYRTDKSLAALYVFNTSDGFVIVSADDCETPIIGYSREGRFNPDNVPMQMEEYLQDFADKIRYSIENHMEADELTAKQWKLMKATGHLNDQKFTQSVAPLLTEMWHQGCLYNSLCPTLSKLPCGHAEVGCVAVAMGQIMHYWKYPAKGFGTHSYTNQGITLSADFGNTTYDWDHMPDSLTESSNEAEIAAVATLLYHCGVGVDMYYTVNGSGASSGNVPNALYRYFSYSKKIHFEKRDNYSDEEWLSMLKDNLDAHRPVMYSGSGNQGGHAFVCDGYDDNDMLHFNWGWGVANGYFSLGNLNPNGYAFNRNQVAILDIIPEYEPCLVVATAHPSAAGAIEGAGKFHIGERCTLTVTPTENVDFYCWQRNGQILSNASSYSFSVEEDTIFIEAHFSLYPVGEVTANYSPEADNPNSNSISLTWSRADSEWKLLKQFPVKDELGGMATDGEYIYVTYPSWVNPTHMFEKYTMEGELAEAFNVDGLSNALCLVHDGTDFYCNNMSSKELNELYRIDLENKRILDTTEIHDMFWLAAYDPEYDGFWLGQDYKTTLYNRQGQRIKSSPSTSPDYIYGSAYFMAEDGNPHLLMPKKDGIYDFDISNNIILDRPLLPIVGDSIYSFGNFTAKYDDKDAMFFVFHNNICIYEINSPLSQIIAYRIYRADSGGNIEMLDETDGTSYTDETWGNVLAGLYRFGVSMVYANGVESEIIWSDFIEKTDYGIEENGQGASEQAVQKIFEDGKIVIIKDGKRYTVTGQRLN
ncbi:MAG: C10 family peptidase [Bacteroidales bacterium]|nr:C10 family peptidase [Bacteroidales bacterium]